MSSGLWKCEQTAGKSRANTFEEARVSHLETSVRTADLDETSDSAARLRSESHGATFSSGSGHAKLVCGITLAIHFDMLWGIEEEHA